MGKKVLIIICCLYLFSIAIGTHFCGGYSGTFVDTETGKPLSGVIVVENHDLTIPTPDGPHQWVGRFREVVTDKSGKFHFWPHLVIPAIPFTQFEKRYTETFFFKPFYSAEGHPWTFIDGEQRERSAFIHEPFTRGGENLIELTPVYTEDEFSHIWPAEIIGGRKSDLIPIWSETRENWKNFRFNRRPHTIYAFIDRFNATLWNLMFYLNETQRAVYWNSWHNYTVTYRNIDSITRYRDNEVAELSKTKDRKDSYLLAGMSDFYDKKLDKLKSSIDARNRTIAVMKSVQEQFEKNSLYVNNHRQETLYISNIEKELNKVVKNYKVLLAKLFDEGELDKEKMSEWNDILNKGLENWGQLPFPVLPIDVMRTDLPVSAPLPVATDDPTLYEFEEPLTGITFIRMQGGILDAGTVKFLPVRGFNNIKIYPSNNLDRLRYSSELISAVKDGNLRAIYDVGDYFVSKTEITQAQWLSIMERNPSIPKKPNSPVNMVTPEGVRIFAKTLAKITGKPFRLINHIEYEHLARESQKREKFDTSLSSSVLDGLYEYGLRCTDYAIRENESDSGHILLLKTGDGFQCSLKPVILGHTEISPWKDIENLRENKSLMNEVGDMGDTDAERDKSLGFRLVLPLEVFEITPNFKQVRLY